MTDRCSIYERELDAVAHSSLPSAVYLRDAQFAREIVEAFPSYAFDRQHTEILAKEVAAAITEARREEREACARYIEALAIDIRDNGPRSHEGLLTGLAGAHVGALLGAAASLLAAGEWIPARR